MPSVALLKPRFVQHGELGLFSRPGVEFPLATTVLGAGAR
jgi:hypothetical protein